VTQAEPDDATLLARHVEGDPEAFGVLVHRHRDRLWAVAMRTLGDREEAADALQDALVSAFRRADSFRGDAAVTTWMHRIVVNACLDRVRRRKARPADPLPEDEDRMVELGETLDEDPAARIEQRSAVLAALRTLPEPQRAALVLVDMEGYSVEEAARILECAEGTIKSRCARGRAKLLPLLRHLRTGEDPGNRSEGAAVPPATVTMLHEQRRGSGDG
jgi:RNA polymerase sigma-70 factor, ECF subfamily